MHVAFHNQWLMAQPLMKSSDPITIGIYEVLAGSPAKRDVEAEIGHIDISPSSSIFSDLEAATVQQICVPS